MKFTSLFAPALATILAASPLQAQLQHYWNFTADQNDVVGGAIGTLHGAGASVSDGVLHLGGYGNPGWVEFSSFLVPTGGASLTVSYFAKAAPESNGLARLISQGHSSGEAGNLGFYMGPNGSGNWITDGWPYVMGPFYQDNEFHHYALTIDDEFSRFYVDAVLMDTRSAMGFNSDGTPTRFGRQFGDYSEYYNGDLDDIRIYGNSLSAAEIAEIADYDNVVTPEPASIALIGTGLVLISAAARRRRRTA